MSSEPERVAAAYARRTGLAALYDPLRPEVQAARQERERALVRLLARHVKGPLAELRVIEVGCGHGDNLLELLRLGFDPARLAGNELLPERLAAARRRLPAELQLFEGDATRLALPPGGFDIAMQSLVFSSLLDDAFQQRLADAMWSWLKPGGAVLWYDFALGNPRNPDVRGVPMVRVRELFPQGRIDVLRVTLAPPLARAAPALYGVLDALPWLRTHRLAWIAKLGPG